MVTSQKTHLKTSKGKHFFFFFWKFDKNSVFTNALKLPAILKEYIKCPNFYNSDCTGYGLAGRREIDCPYKDMPETTLHSITVI